MTGLSLPSTSGRVERNTPDWVTHMIERQTLERLAHFADNPHEIGRRLAELDREWDIERLLEANASSLGLGGMLLGLFLDRRFLVLPTLVAAFLLQHALQGWCPPLPVLRRRGVRTAAEIERERYALKALRGDFAELKAGPRGAGWGAGQPPSARDRARVAFAAASARSH